MTTEIHDELEGLGRYDFGWADKDVAGVSDVRCTVYDLQRHSGDPKVFVAPVFVQGPGGFTERISERDSQSAVHFYDMTFSPDKSVTVLHAAFLTTTVFRDHPGPSRYAATSTTTTGSTLVTVTRSRPLPNRFAARWSTP